EISGAEDDRDELAHRGERAAAGEADLERTPGREVRPGEARGKSRGIVGDHEIAGAEEIDEGRSRPGLDVAVAPDDQQPGARRMFDGLRGGDHAVALASCRALVASADAIASASSRAAVSGRFKSEGSASGTAIRCRAVSMSPGSRARRRIPAGLSSSAQIRVMCWSAALLAP